MALISYHNHMNRFLFLIFMGFFACESPRNDSTSEVQPNILFIMSDDHTSQAWGIYGGLLQNIARNRNIRRLASEGATLNKVFLHQFYLCT